MNGALAQDVAVTLIAAAAVGWLVWRRVRARRRGRGAACENCPIATAVPGTRPAPAPQRLIRIGEPPARRP